MNWVAKAEKYYATKSDAQLMAMLRRLNPGKYGDEDAVIIHVDPS